MGRSNTYKCPCCNYKVITSAGPDAGFMAATNTFVCLDCKIVTDIVIKKFNRLINQSDQAFENADITPIKCSTCEGINLKEWDIKKKPCLKCETSMKISSSGLIISWD